MEKKQKEFKHSTHEKIVRLEEKTEKIWDCLLQMSDKITEIKYLIKTHINKN